MSFLPPLLKKVPESFGIRNTSALALWLLCLPDVGLDPMKTVLGTYLLNLRPRLKTSLCTLSQKPDYEHYVCFPFLLKIKMQATIFKIIVLLLYVYAVRL